MTVADLPSDSAASHDGSSKNPVGDAFNVTISVPESIEVRMVNADTLGDYEIWLFVSSVFASIAVGFGVAYIQSGRGAPGVPADADPNDGTLLGVTLLFVAFFVFGCVMAWLKRRTLTSKSSRIRFRGAEVVEPAP